ncbi:unnamed protein product [Callosobruchus maculatus]|uniref:Uncharacterized protein n=1 Tax=Callosobruchus maculatus TaxID=64391 RepID=A0A653DX14_CALMS|nr:unnamed protein product [Callosobruchus maculatus]
MGTDGILNKELVDKFKKSFYADEKNLLAQNVCSRTDIFDVCLSRKTLEETQHVYNHKKTMKIQQFYGQNIK